MLFRKNSTVVMIGDSISDCGRARPLGEGRDDAVGRGYISLVNAMLRVNYPGLCLRVINMGVSGDNTRHLLARWQTDVLDLNPDYVTVHIGINDVWRQFDRPQIVDQHVYPEEYRDNLKKIITLTLPATRDIILLSPYIMEPNVNDPMRKAMDQYTAIAGDTAKEYGLKFVNLQSAFDGYFQHNHPMAVAWDRIHPDMTGHMIIAKAFLKEVGFEWK